MVDKEALIQKMKDALLSTGDPEPLLVVEGRSGEALFIPIPWHSNTARRQGQMFGYGALIGADRPVKTDSGQQISSPLALLGDVAEIHLGFMAWMLQLGLNDPAPEGSFANHPDKKEVLVWMTSKHKFDVVGQHFTVERGADGPVLEELTEGVVSVRSFLTDAFWDGLAIGQLQKLAGKAQWN